MTTNLELYEDMVTRLFHYQPYEVGKKNARSGPALCGEEIQPTWRKAAWFPVGDPRGNVHYDRGCPGCAEGLARMMVEKGVD